LLCIPIIRPGASVTRKNSIGSGHAAAGHAYLHAVAVSVADAGAVLITRPAGAKTELLKYVHFHGPKLMNVIVGWKPSIIRATRNSLLMHENTSWQRIACGLESRLLCDAARSIWRRFGPPKLIDRAQIGVRETIGGSPFGV